jgi:hypothetical protein
MISRFLLAACCAAIAMGAQPPRIVFPYAYSGSQRVSIRADQETALKQILKAVLDQSRPDELVVVDAIGKPLDDKQQGEFTRYQGIPTRARTGPGLCHFAMWTWHRPCSLMASGRLASTAPRIFGRPFASPHSTPVVATRKRPHGGDRESRLDWEVTH